MRAAILALAVAAAACTPAPTSQSELEPGPPPTAEEIRALEAAAQEASVAAARGQLEELERVFAAETRNEEWARAQEAMLRNSLADAGAVAASSQVECRAQLCRATVSQPAGARLASANPAAGEEIAAGLARSLGLSAGACAFALFGPLPDETEAPVLRVFLDCRQPIAP